MKLTDWGRAAANPAASANSTVRFPKCEPCEETLACQDLGTQALAGSITVTGIVYNGETYTFPGILVTNTTEINNVIGAIIEQFEIEPILNVSYSGGDLTVEHWGAFPLTSVVTSGTNVTMVRECETEIVCEYPFSVSATFTVNGESITVSGASTPTTIATAVSGELEGVGYKDVEVTEAPSGTFNVIVKAIRGFELDVNGNEVISRNCMLGWKTADDTGE
jgi:stage V sporulation protein SpoVS